MNQRQHSWKAENGKGPCKGSWLSMLIDAMEQAARPELRIVPCDRSVLAAVRLQLARPALPYLPGASRFSFRN